MKISADTKISAIIRHNTLSIEAIASICPDLEKLRNPILRKLLASRVSIRDAAKISGADISIFFKVLAPLGYEAEQAIQSEKKTETSSQAQANINITEYSTILDVRPILKEHKDPFHEIMKSLGELPMNGTLLLINSFEPIPLYKVITCKGYTHNTLLKDGVYYVEICRNGEASEEKKEQSLQSSFESLCETYRDKMIRLDVRTMEMPLPMITILQELENNPGKMLYVIHRKFPHFLIPELNQRDYNIATNEVSENEIHLIIYKE